MFLGHIYTIDECKFIADLTYIAGGYFFRFEVEIAPKKLTSEFKKSGKVT